MSYLRNLLYKRRKFYDDDFDWNNYTQDSYRRRLRGDVEARFRTIFTEGQLSFDSATGKVDTHGVPIHPNQQLILEAIGQLGPASVHEVGCGGGDHLAGAAKLFPNIDVTGGDRGVTQLELAVSRHPELAGKIGVQDITMPFSHRWPRADLVYTQAVIMHIHTAVSHFVALANLVRMARAQVLLMENPQCHNLVQDFRCLQDDGHLDWPELHIYEFRGSTGARAILLSRQVQDLPPLRDDAQIRDGMAASGRRLSRADKDSARGLFGFERYGTDGAAET